VDIGHQVSKCFSNISRHLPEALSDVLYALGCGLAPLREALLKLNAELLDILYVCG
jgi:hypothetical protein